MHWRLQKLLKTLKLLKAPIFIFQMGKVGSSSVQATLSQNYRGVIIHAHNYQMLTKSQKTLLKWRKRFRLPLYVICPVREPLSRNISAFFQNFEQLTGFEFNDKEWTSDELLDLFLKKYPHSWCLEWFDENLKTTFGVDVFSETFPIVKKWKVYKHKSSHVLVYRSDLDHSTQLDLISKFSRRKISEWTYSNISTETNYGEIYKSFVKAVRLPDIYISIMCNSRFCQKFWSREEICAIKEKFNS